MPNGDRRRQCARTQFRIFHTVSAIAIAAVVAQLPTQALSQDGQTRLILEANGGPVLGDSQPWSIVGIPFLGFGVLQTIRPEYTLGGLVGIVTPLDRIAPEIGAGLDFGAYARLGATNSENQSGVGPYFNILGGVGPEFFTEGYATQRETYAIVDLEVRKELEIAAEALTTLKVGLRGGYFNARTDADFYNFIFDDFLNETRNTTFVGAGPRAGLEHVIPIAPNLTFDLSGAGALLFGTKERKVSTIDNCCVGSSASSNSSFDVVPMLEGSAALSFRPFSSAATISVGVRSEAWFGVFDQTTLVSNTDDANRYFVSPFIRLTSPIGGAPEPGVSANAYTAGETGAPAFGGVLEAGGWGGYLWRDGDALNFSGQPNFEIDSYPLAGGDVRASLLLEPGLLAQVEIAGEAAFFNKSVIGLSADDTYSSGYTGGGQLAFTNNRLLIGGFVGAGQVFFNDDSSLNQDADHWLAGGSARYLTEFGSLGVQAGYLDSRADNSETLSDAAFVRATAQKFFNNGQGLIQAGFGYADGTQDADDPPVNSTDVLSWDVTVEHQLTALSTSNAAASAFLSYQGLHVSEASTSGGNDKITDQGVYAGLRIRLGAGGSLYERERNTAPGLPNVARWLGAVPAVD